MTKTRDQIKEKVLQEVQNQLGLMEPVTEDAKTRDLGFDELDYFELLLTLEDDWDIPQFVDDADFEKCETIGAMIDWLVTRLHAVTE